MKATIKQDVGAKQAGKPVDVLSVSFVSPSTGWLLGEQGEDPSQVLVLKTADGGQTWLPAPAPAAPAAGGDESSTPPDAVGSIIFTSKLDGWAFGPALWSTTNGGANWLRQQSPGPIADLTVADGQVFVVTRSADSSGKLSVYVAANGTDSWHPVPGTAMTGFSAQSLAVSGQTGYLLADSQGHAEPVLLAGPATGSGSWQALPQPCTGATGMSAAFAADPGGRLFIGCAGEPGVGNQLKTAYLSSDGGRSWQQVASPPFGGYLSQATMNPGGTIFLSGARMDIYISTNRGRSWQQSPSLANANSLANAGFSLTATTVINNFGVAIQGNVSTQQVWLTEDGGLRWTPVTVQSSGSS